MAAIQEGTFLDWIDAYTIVLVKIEELYCVHIGDAVAPTLVAPGIVTVYAFDL